MRNATATTFLWAEAIWYVWIIPALRLYLIYTGIVFNVVLFILLVWG